MYVCSKKTSRYYTAQKLLLQNAQSVQDMLVYLGKYRAVMIYHDAHTNERVRIKYVLQGRVFLYECSSWGIPTGLCLYVCKIPIQNGQNLIINDNIGQLKRHLEKKRQLSSLFSNGKRGAFLRTSGKSRARDPTKLIKNSSQSSIVEYKNALDS